MNVTFPSSEPAGFKTRHIFRLPTSEVVTSGQTYANGGAVLFKLNSPYDDVEVILDVWEWRFGPELAYVDLPVARGGRDHFILLDEFPPDFVKDHLNCYYELQLKFAGQGQGSTAVDVRISSPAFADER